MRLHVVTDMFYFYDYCCYNKLRRAFPVWTWPTRLPWSRISSTRGSHKHKNQEHVSSPELFIRHICHTRFSERWEWSHIEAKVRTVEAAFFWNHFWFFLTLRFRKLLWILFKLSHTHAHTQILLSNSQIQNQIVTYWISDHHSLNFL